jgi:CheY-like chemotaxis protein
MPSFSTSPVRRTASLQAKNHPTVGVVDPQNEAYASWQAEAETHGARLAMFASAEEALRFSGTTSVDLWVVNVSLPRLSGLEFCQMLKNRQPQAAVYLIADQYSAETERAAWQARATFFGCKGGHETWLGDWLRERSARSAAVVPQSIAVLTHSPC